jgi:hypothetical protein
MIHNAKDFYVIYRYSQHYVGSPVDDLLFDTADEAVQYATEKNLDITEYVVNRLITQFHHLMHYAQNNPIQSGMRIAQPMFTEPPSYMDSYPSYYRKNPEAAKALATELKAMLVDIKAKAAEKKNEAESKKNL